MNNNLIQTMGAQWNLSHHYNQNSYLPQNMGLDLPFFPPQEMMELKPVLISWDPTPKTMQAQVLVNLGNMGHQEPQAAIPQDVRNPMEEGMEDPINLIGELMVESSNLDEVKVFLFEEMREKRHILACQNSLFKCTLQVYYGHPPIPGSHSGEASNDLSTQSKEEPIFSL